MERSWNALYTSGLQALAHYLSAWFWWFWKGDPFQSLSPKHVQKEKNNEWYPLRYTNSSLRGFTTLTHQDLTKCLMNVVLNFQGFQDDGAAHWVQHQRAERGGGRGQEVIKPLWLIFSQLCLCARGEVAAEQTEWKRHWSMKSFIYPQDCECRLTASYLGQLPAEL